MVAIRLLLVACWLLLFPPRFAAAASPLLVTVGEVTDTTAVVWGRGSDVGPLTVEARPEHGGPRVTASTRLSRAGYFIGKLPLRGLAPGTRYAYRLSHGKQEVAGSFVTAPHPTQSRPITFLWSGDLGGKGHCRRARDGYRIFDTMGSLRLDFFLFVGDTIYADHRCGGPDRVPGYDFIAATLKDFRKKHLYNRADPHVQAFFRTTSVYAIWDDHDVRNDFAGPSEPRSGVGLQSFIESWPLIVQRDEPNRLYRSTRWGRLAELFILDTRQYRSNNQRPDGPEKTMLGPAQRRWLVNGVTRSPAVWKIVVSSVPLAIATGRGARDSWSSGGDPRSGRRDGTGFSVERDAILKAFEARGVKNLLWLTADVHHAQVIRHEPWPGLSFHESMAGPLAAPHWVVQPLDASLKSRSLFGLEGVENFGAVTIDASGLTLRIIDAAGTTRFQHTIAPE
jgi:alkaline phosphatase D